MVVLAWRYCSCSLANSVSEFLSNLIVTYSDVDLCVHVIHPPLCEVCSNYEVVVFQPWTWTAKYLGSVTSITPFILALLRHLFQPVFWVVLFPSSIITPPSSVTVCCNITSLCCTHYPPPHPERNAVQLDVVHTCHESDSATQLCSPRRVTAYAAVSHVRLSPLC